MRRTVLTVPLLFVIVLLSGCRRDLPPQQAHALLRQVQQARQSVTLQGKLTTAIVLGGQPVRADAKVQRGPGVIRLQYTSGKFAGWQIMEQDGYVWMVNPKGVAAPSPIAPDAGMAVPLQPNLRVTYTGRSRVAGRWARRYVIRPPHQGRGRLEIAVDAETAMPLSTRKYRTDGQLLSETTYHEIRYDAPPPPRVTPPAVATRHGAGQFGLRARQTTERALQKLLGGPLLKPAYLPAGLQLRGYYSRTGRRGTVAEMRYSDGLRNLVVAQAKIPQRRQPRAGQAPEGPEAERWERWRQQWRERAKSAPNPSQRQPGRWWERFGQGRRGPGRLRPERRGDRVVIVAGDISQAELQKVMSSIPHPPEKRPGTGF